MVDHIVGSKVIKRHTFLTDGISFKVYKDGEQIVDPNIYSNCKACLFVEQKQGRLAATAGFTGAYFGHEIAIYQLRYEGRDGRFI
ncbi:hypothetical protein D1872_282930 [compost metagenome]